MTDSSVFYTARATADRDCPIIKDWADECPRCGAGPTDRCGVELDEIKRLTGKEQN